MLTIAHANRGGCTLKDDKRFRNGWSHWCLVHDLEILYTCIYAAQVYSINLMQKLSNNLTQKLSFKCVIKSYCTEKCCSNAVCSNYGPFSWNVCCCRPFRLTRAIARARASTRANLSARAICRMHEKSYSAEKVLFHWIFFFQSFVFVYECIFE